MVGLRHRRIDMRLRYATVALAGLGFAGLAVALVAARRTLEPWVAALMQLIGGDYRSGHYGFAVAWAAVTAVLILGALGWRMARRVAIERRIDAYLRSREAPPRPAPAAAALRELPLPERAEARPRSTASR
jgi:hypothetical protein